MKTEYVRHPSQFNNDMLRKNIQSLPLNFSKASRKIQQNPEVFHYVALYEPEHNNMTSEELRSILETHIDEPNIVECAMTQPAKDEYGFGTDECYVMVQVWTAWSSEGASGSTGQTLMLIRLDTPSESL